MPAHLVNVGFRSTNYWVIGTGPDRLIVDLGWPGMFGALIAQLDRMGVPLRELRYGLATHFHMDHAGAAQELKDAGMRLIMVDVQVGYAEPMRATIKADAGYRPLAFHDNVPLTCAESRAFLARIGLAGEIVHTPGHSNDSVSLVLDDGAVFTGDLTWPSLAVEADAITVLDSWARLRAKGAKTVYAGHGPVRPVPAVGDG